MRAYPTRTSELAPFSGGAGAAHFFRLLIDHFLPHLHCSGFLYRSVTPPRHLPEQGDSQLRANLSGLCRFTTKKISIGEPV